MNKENEEVNIVEIVKLMSRYWILILLLTASIVLFSYWYTVNNTSPTYKATVILFVGKEIGNEESLSITDLQVGKQLLADYKELIMTDLVIEEVLSELSLDMSPSELRNALSMNIKGQSRLLEISYVSGDPQSAVIISDKTAEILVDKSVEVLKENNIQIIDYAKDQPEKSEPELLLNMMIAFIIGLMFSLFVTLIIVMSKKTFQSKFDVEKNTKLSVLGVLPRFKYKQDTVKGIKNIISFSDYNSTLSRSFKSFRINLEYSGINHKHKIFMFTAPDSDDGKAISIINTAVSFVQAGRKVLLMECDYFENKLHRLLQLSKVPGLKYYLMDGKKNLLETVSAVTGTENMRFLPSGIMSQDQANIFSLSSFSDLLEEARNKFDVVLINAPAILCSIDSMTISSKVDAVVLVIEQRKTKKASVNRSVDLLGRAGSNMTGVLINQPTRNTR